jgi:hypothetical protein
VDQDPPEVAEPEELEESEAAYPLQVDPLRLNYHPSRRRTP